MNDSIGSKRRAFILPALLIVGLALYDFNIIETDSIRVRSTFFLMALFSIVYSMGMISRRYQRISNPLIGPSIFVLWCGLFSGIMLWGQPEGAIADFVSSAALLVVNVSVVGIMSGTSINWGSFRQLLRIWVAIAIPVALFGLYQAGANYFPLPLPDSHPLFGYGNDNCLGDYCRPSSFFSEASHLGVFLIPPILIVITSVLNRTDTAVVFPDKRWNLLALVLLAFAFLLAYSEASYLAAFVVALLAFLFSKRKLINSQALRRASITIAGLIGILILTLQVIGSDFVQAFAARSHYAITTFSPIHDAPEKGNLVVSSAQGRYWGTVRVLRIWLDHPILGVGLNNTENLFQEYTIQGKTLPSVPGVGWGQILSDIGILGLLSFITLYSVVIKQLWSRITHTPDPRQCSVLIALLLIISADLVMRFASGGVVNPRDWLHLGFAGLSLNISWSSQTCK